VGLHKARVRALQALVAGVPCLAANPQHSLLQQEFNEVYAVRKVRRSSRRRILEVLHSTRALDSTLKAFVRHHGCLPKPKKGKTSTPPSSLGGYLYALRDHAVVGLGAITEPQRHGFQAQIVDTRNVYMHEAGAFPVLDADVQTLLSEMHTCLWVVSRL
jgi:hypothetical protein